jgi:DNA-binding MarR family transcriptional regulator
MPKNSSFISVENRVLLHLLKFNAPKYEFEVPGSLTQKGIAKAINANQSYVSIPINKFLKEGKIKEYSGHVNHGKRKQKYYLLTKKGEKFTKKIRSNLLNIEISIRESNGKIIIKPLGKVTNYIEEQETFSNISEMDIYSSISNDCIIDINCLRREDKKRIVDYSSNAPVIHSFYGRNKELSFLKDWVGQNEDHNVINIYGMAGIGKTTLVAKFIESYRQEKHLFWYKFTKSDTLRTTLFELSKFLSKLGFHELEINLRAHKKFDNFQVMDILNNDLGKVTAILIFDDFQKSSDPVNDFFEQFIQNNNNSMNTKIIILSRLLHFYSKKDEAEYKTVSELELNGLDFEETCEMLKEKGIDESRFEKIYKLSNGNPFYLESMVGLEEYIHGELYFDLSDEEKELIGFLSVLRFPISENCMTHRDHRYLNILPLLTQKSIIKTDANNLFYVHDIMKDFFYIRLSPSQRLANHRGRSRKSRTDSY